MEQHIANLQNIAVSEIRPNPAKLREADLESIEFIQLAESIRDRGLLSAITVRVKQDIETEMDYYELADGNNRFNACKHIGLETIPAIILDVDAEGDDAEVEILLTQIVANTHRIKTKPAEYASSLIRIMGAKPMLTVEELAGQLSVSIDWLKSTLKLGRIENETIKEHIDSGRLQLSNAYLLAGLDPEDQADMLEEALNEDNKSFNHLVSTRKKQRRDERAEGRKTQVATFTPRARMRNMKAVSEVADNEGLIDSIVAEAQPSTPAEAFKLALDFVRHLDPVTIASEKADWDAKQVLKAEKAKQSDATKAAKKAADLKKKADAAQAEADKMNLSADEATAE